MRILLGAAFLLALRAGGAAAQEAEFQAVTVKPGDTLWSISQRYLKDPTRWNEILRHNRLSTSDPTIALPGMVLRVPKEMIKEDLRSAELVYAMRKVLSRPADKAEWGSAEKGRQLYHGDGLRTLADSWARVQFFGGAVLSLDPDSMAILKSPKKEDHDIRVMRGGVHTMQARVLTPSARITPKDSQTKYTARVLDDLSTRVQVHQGAAEVEGGGKTVEVREGFFTEVPLARAPAPPAKAPAVGAMNAEIADIRLGEKEREAMVSIRRVSVGRESAVAPDPGRVATEVREVEVGVPVAAYRVQVSRSELFESVVFERLFDVDQEIDLRAAKLAPGQYWLRAATIDLLGAQGRFSPPKVYAVK